MDLQLEKKYLANRDSKFVDIDGMKADYKYNLYNASQEEECKLNRGDKNGNKLVSWSYGQN